MRKKIFFMLLVFVFFFSIYKAISKPASPQGLKKNTSRLIPYRLAREWIHNYAQHPISQMTYNQDEVNVVKIKSFEMDNQIIDTIRAHPEIRGLRCYFAKRSSEETKKDYTVLVVPYSSTFANIASADSLRWVFDWHKPTPPSSSIEADTLGGPIINIK